MLRHYLTGQDQRDKTHSLFTLGALLLVLSGCASAPKTAEEAGLPSTAETIAAAGLNDQRGVFRELFCASLEQHGQDLFGYEPCEDALIADPQEPPGTGETPTLVDANSDYLLLMVAGLGWECLADWLDYDLSGALHLARFGYDARVIDVGGLTSSEHNAKQIRDYIAALPPEDRKRPIILLGYSKGAPDILTALVSYPEVAERVVAMVSVAGAVRGSPLADDASQGQANLLGLFPGADCEKGDEGAVASLNTARRQAFLADNTLPAHISYYSLVTSPTPEQVSRGLRITYNTLADIDPRNDSQLLFSDQMIPGSTLLALLNADHWAVAVPIAESHEIIAGTLIDQNKFPREALLEAIMRYIERDLSPQ